MAADMEQPPPPPPQQAPLVTVVAQPLVVTQQPQVARVVYPARRVVVIDHSNYLYLQRVVPPGAAMGGHWLRVRYCGPITWCCAVVWTLLFWPIAICICMFKLDECVVYDAPNGSFQLDGSPAPAGTCC